MAKDLNINFIKRDIQIASERCSTSLAIKEIQIKVRIRNHCTPIRMAKINADNTKC